jgi:hypothetical protein
MGLESRDGRLYYYRKRRAGGRVTSEYVGAGRLAAAMAALDAEEREEEEARREAARREVARMCAEDDAFESVSEMVEAIARAAFVVAGFHRHKGQWRLIRGGKK